MVELILIEILAVPADRSRGKHRPRVVKRKMSSYPIRRKNDPTMPACDIGKAIQIVK